MNQRKLLRYGRRPAGSHLSVWLAVVAVSMFFVLVTQAVILGPGALSLSAWLSWARYLPLNVLIVLTLYLTALLVFNQFAAATALTAGLLLLVNAINPVKLSNLNTPFVFADFMRVSEALSIATLYVSIPLLILLAVALAGFAAGIVLLLIKRPRGLLTRRGRGLLALGILLCAAAAWFFCARASESFDRADLRTSAASHGFFVSFVGAIPDAFVGRPDTPYTEEDFSGLAAQASAGNHTPADDTRPHIVLVLLESMADPLDFAGIDWNTDPIPNLRRLMDAGQGGHFISSEYGGNTANVEFEVLTGLSMAFLPEFSSPYNRYIKDDMMALPRRLGELGYTTEALHLNSASFWNRDEVYPRLGFDQFISLDNMDRDRYPPDFSPGWAADAVLADIIADRIREADGPQFLFALTVEGHGPYDAGKYPRGDMSISAHYQGTYLEAESAWGEAMYRADHMIGELMATFDDMDEPVLLVCFGDHAPGLKKSLYPAPDLKQIATPCGFWNSSAPVKPEYPYFSASLLPEMILDAAELEKGAWFETLYREKKVIPVHTRYRLMDGNGQDTPSRSASEQKAYERLHILNYEALFGNSYARKYLWNPG